MELLIMQFYPVFIYNLPLKPSTFLSTLFTKYVVSNAS